MRDMDMVGGRFIDCLTGIDAFFLLLPFVNVDVERDFIWLGREVGLVGSLEFSF
jgi:hypothetical protein